MVQLLLALSCGVTIAHPSDTAIDQAALSSQKQAITSLKNLLGRYRNHPKEADLLYRLGAIYVQKGGLEFRVATARSQPLTKASFRQAVRHLNRLITRYPMYTKIHKALFLRAKAHYEAGHKAAATRDYRLLVKKYPSTPEAVPAHMALANQASKRALHLVAIRHLRFVEAHPEHDQYPFALQKLAWAHYNLKQPKNSLEFVRKHSLYYDDKLTRQKYLETAEEALRENLLRDGVLFYLEGYEQDPQIYSPIAAYDFFRQLSKGDVQRKLWLRLAQLWRSHDHVGALEKWREILLDKELNSPVTLDVARITYDYFHTRRNYPKATTVLKDFLFFFEENRTAIAENPTFQTSYRKVVESLAISAQKLQMLILKNKRATKVASLVQPLARIYETMIHLLPQQDPRIPDAHYNLAETQFQIEEFEAATRHYRWVMDHYHQKSRVKRKDVSLKAIASGYRALEKAKLVAKKITATALNKDEDDNLPEKFAIWLRWVDDHRRAYPKETKAAFLQYEYEAARTLYRYHHLKDALERFTVIGTLRPQSKHAQAAVSLIVDTFIQSNDWAATHDTAQAFLQVSYWKKHPFGKKLFRLGARASYQMVKNQWEAEDNKATLSASNDFIETYQKHSLLEEVLYLSGQAANRNHDEDLALERFSVLLKKFPRSQYRFTVRGLRAKIYEKRYQTRLAAQDYLEYLKSVKPRKERLNLRNRILALTWISGNPRALDRVIKDATICRADNRERCQQYSGFLALNQKSGKKNIYQQVSKSVGLAKPVWAVVALQNNEGLSYPKRLRLTRILARHWQKIEPMMQLSLLPYISISVGGAFKQNRLALLKHNRLKSPAHINRRVKKIREMEVAATFVVKKLPWARIRAAVLNEVALLYLDFGRSLSQMRAPASLKGVELATYKKTVQDIVFPFEEKGHQLRRKAYEIGAENRIEDDTFLAIATPFMKDNPSQALELKRKLQAQGRVSLSVTDLTSLDPGGDWRYLLRKKPIDFPNYTSTPHKYVKTRWLHALRARNWSNLMYLTQTAHQHEVLDEKEVELLNAIALAAAGARAEGLTALNRL